MTVSAEFDWRARLAGERREQVRARVGVLLRSTYKVNADERAYDRAVVLEKHVFQWALSMEDYVQQIMQTVTLVQLDADRDEWAHEWFSSSAEESDDEDLSDLQQHLQGLLTS